MAIYTRTDAPFSDPSVFWNLDLRNLLNSNGDVLFSFLANGSITDPVLNGPDGTTFTVQGTFNVVLNGLTLVASGTVTGLIFTSGGQTIATLSDIAAPVSISHDPVANLTSATAPLLSDLFAGNDLLFGGIQDDLFFGFRGNDQVSGGGGHDTMNYATFTDGPIVANVAGGNGTVNKGAGNGVDTFTSVEGIAGTTQNDVFYVDAGETVYGGGGFDYLIELAPGAHLTYGVNFTGISEIVCNTGSNVINAAGDPDQIAIYGSSGNDTLTLGSGGGWLFGEGGSNTLNGGANATNVFVGGGGGSDTMNGGTGTAVNVYYVDGNDRVNGAGAFNIMIELGVGVTVQLGSAQYQHVQEFVGNSGTNVVTVAPTDSDFVYLYGGTGNDTLSTGPGGGYLIDNSGGTNTLNGGGGTNVFIGGGSGIDTMNGGTGSNVYYIDGNSRVHGAGTFNAVLAMQPNVSLTLGSAQLGTDVQQVVLSGGTNSVDFHTATGTSYFYGAAGNDTFKGGIGDDLYFGSTGSNTFQMFNGWGRDVIMDWMTGSSNVIDMTALAGQGVHSLADLSQSIVGGSDVISHAGHGSAADALTIKNVGSTLGAGSFLFG